MAQFESNLNERLLGERNVSQLTNDDLEFLFHPDNIKNMCDAGTGGKEQVSESLHRLWTVIGGSKGLARSLNSNLKTGIEGTKADIQQRIDKFGANKKRPVKIRTLCELILENFEDRILQILIMAAAVALTIGIIQHGLKNGWVEGTSIFMAIAIIVSVTAGNNYVKEKQFQKLVSKASADICPVFRGVHGDTQTISGDDLVVGDLVILREGDRIPADCILIESTDFATDESPLTGEPEQVEKSHVNEVNYKFNPNPFLLAKTLIVNGQGIAMVCTVGTHTRSGMAEEKLNIEDEETPLQSKLETIANEIGKVGVYVAILTFIAMTANLVFKTLMNDKEIFTMENLSHIVNYIIIGITVIVVAVPEGLPLAVTISLAFSVMKMKKENNLVRKLEASETMGGANEICTDKTGTLTLNQMSVKEFYTMDQTFTKPSNLSSIKTAELLTEGVLFNCSARVEIEKGQHIPKGNCTEVGMINFLQDVGVNAYEILKTKEGNILTVVPFNSMRKRASTVIRHPTKADTVRVFLKGAPEIVLEYCSKKFDKDGNQIQLGENGKEQIIHEIVSQNFAKKAYRTLLVAYKDLTVAEFEALKKENNDFAHESDRQVLEKDMVVIGIYALMDPLRREIIDSVKKCHSAGINIRMVTGDNLDTAKAIAIEAGIVSKEEAENQYVCMTGADFRVMCQGLKKLEDPSNRGLTKESVGNMKQFKIIQEKLKVLARSTPEDKYMLVTGLKQLDSVVAVTGDGTNDAPALKKADVGFAMGITGTEVAKEASDIILLDDNFASIITAVKWGRNIYTNVRKFLQFQLTVNVVAMFIVFFGGVVVADPPLTAVQMLWVNLIMDTMAALALATEPPSDSLLTQKPYNRSELIVTPVMWRNIIGQALFQIAVLIVLLFAGKSLFGIEYADDALFYNIINDVSVPTEKTRHYTIIFNTFVFMQVFNEINSRKLGAKEYNVFAGFFNNLLFLGIILFTIGVQYVLVQHAGQPLRCVPLTLNEHIVCLCIGLFSFIQAVLVKAFLPVSWFEKLHMKEETMTDEEEKEAFTTKFRKSFRSSIKKSGNVQSTK